jgi:hypothetical protein
MSLKWPKKRKRYRRIYTLYNIQENTAYIKSALKFIANNHHLPSEDASTTAYNFD